MLCWVECMHDEEVLAKVTLVKGVEAVNVTAIVNTGAHISIISRRLAEKLGCLIELEEVMEVERAKKGVTVRVVGYCIPSRIIFQGERVPPTLLYVAEDLIEDMIVGRHEIDLWGIVFTKEGPRATRRVLRVV
jgi:hypothetical protein